MKVCGAGLNIPGSTQRGFLRSLPFALLRDLPWGRAKVCAMLCLSQVSQVGEGKPGFKPKSGDAVIASVSPGTVCVLLLTLRVSHLSRRRVSASSVSLLVSSERCGNLDLFTPLPYLGPSVSITKSLSAPLPRLSLLRGFYLILSPPAPARFPFLERQLAPSGAAGSALPGPGTALPPPARG